MADETRPLLSEDWAQTYYTISETLSPDVEVVGQGTLGPENDCYQEKPNLRRMLTTMLPTGVGIFLAAMDVTVVASSYVSIGGDFKQLRNASWIATGYMITFTSFQPLYGKLSDIFGRKECLLFAYVAFGLGCLACGVSRTMTELIIARIISGIGGGGMLTVVLIIASDIVPRRKRGTWRGIISTIFALGLATGAPLGGFLSDSVGWRWTFLLQVPFTFIAFMSVLLALHLPDTSASLELLISSKLRRVDFLGAITLILTIVALLFGLDRGSNTEWTSPYAYGPLATSLFLLLLLAFIETTPSLAAEPFAPKHVIVNPSLLGSYFLILFTFTAVMCNMFHVSLYAQVVHGKDATGAGMTLIPAIFANLCGSLTSGLVIQYTGKYKRLAVGAMVSLVMGGTLTYGMVAMSLAGSLTGVAVGFTLMQLGAGIASTTTLVALVANVADADQAITTSLSSFFRSLGGIFGISIGSALVQHMVHMYLKIHLLGSGKDINEILRGARESLSYIDKLDIATQVIIRMSYKQALLVVFWTSTAMGICALISSFFIREESLERSGATT